jgi:hypothetical protein
LSKVRAGALQPSRPCGRTQQHYDAAAPGSRPDPGSGEIATVDAEPTVGSPGSRMIRAADSASADLGLASWPPAATGRRLRPAPARPAAGRARPSLAVSKLPDIQNQPKTSCLDLHARAADLPAATVHPYPHPAPRLRAGVAPATDGRQVATGTAATSAAGNLRTGPSAGERAPPSSKTAGGRPLPS